MNYIKIESIDGTIRAINVDTIVYVQSCGDDMCEICHVSGGNSNVVVARRNIDSVLDGIDNIKHYEMMSGINGRRT